jgi:mannose-6-phosphate isomerase
VLAEIQQRSDATFRLYDYGRQRELHEDSAIAVSDAGPVQAQSGARRLTAERTALIASPHFIFELIDLPANSNWALKADRETWILVIEGQARIGLANTTVGDVIFVEADRAGIDIGPDGMSALIAYPGPDPAISLLQDAGAQMTKSVGSSPVRSPALDEIVGART